MAAQAALAQGVSSPAVNAAQLQAGRIASLRQRDGISSGNIAVPSFSGNETDEADELQRDQNADRFANGIGSPLPSLYINLGENQDEQSESANSDSEQYSQSSDMDEEAMRAYTSLQSQTEENEQSRLRLRSILKNIKAKENTEEYQKALDELRQFLQKRQIDLYSKGASIVDEGEFAEMLDTVGMAISTSQIIISIFQDSIPDKVKKTIPIPPLQFSKSAMDVAIGAIDISVGLKYTLILFVLAPYIISFFTNMYVAICGSSAPCDAIWGAIFNTIGL